MSEITKNIVYECLQRVIDPETNLNIVDMGLIYDVALSLSTVGRQQVVITYTLTTPGCPLAGSFQYMIQTEMAGLKSETFDPEQDIVLQLTFDPPWNLDLMSEEARAELGF